MLLLAACLLVVAQDAAPSAPAADPLRPSPLERVVVAGASVSAGFGLQRDTGMPVSFGEVLDAVVVAPHGVIADRADFFFSRSPEGVGRLMIDSVKDARPTLVVAVDFLFWFGYGSVPDERRLARLEVGLDLLEELRCPVVVADLPDMAPAARGIMLHPLQVPRPSALEALNERIRAWVEERPERHLIEFAECVALIRDGAAIEIGGVRWPAERAADLLQPDDLHPTLLGASMIAALVGDVLARETEELDGGAFDRDVAAVAERVRARVASRGRRDGDDASEDP